MNELPFPAWHLMDMEMYYDIGMPHNPFMKSREFLTVMTERGCPEKCSFCTTPQMWGSLLIKRTNSTTTTSARAATTPTIFPSPNLINIKTIKNPIKFYT